MHKLLSVICSIFALYSAFVIESSRAELSCNLTSGHPSMISAGIIDTTGGDRSNEVVEIKLEATKVPDSSYNLKSCYLLANANSGDFYKKNKTLLIPMESYGANAAKAKFRGQARLPKNIGSLGAFKIYCDLPGPNVEETTTLSMELSVWVNAKKFVQESKNCKIRSDPENPRIAESVTVYSPLSFKSEYTVDIVNIENSISRGDIFAISHTYFQESDPITLGTYAEYFVPGTVDCLVNGQKGIAVARSSFFKDVKLVFNAALPRGQNYKITCPSIISKITSGNQHIPSILKFLHGKSLSYTLATNIYVA